MPVFKCGDRHKPANYRPISLTSLVKAMEKVIHSHIISALKAKNLLNTFQFGFLSHRSTIDLLFALVMIWLWPWRIYSLSLHCLLLDFSKAFDSVPHDRLLIYLVLGANYLPGYVGLISYLKRVTDFKSGRNIYS